MTHVYLLEMVFADSWRTVLLNGFPGSTVAVFSTPEKAMNAAQRDEVTTANPVPELHWRADFAQEARWVAHCPNSVARAYWRVAQIEVDALVKNIIRRVESGLERSLRDDRS